MDQNEWKKWYRLPIPDWHSNYWGKLLTLRLPSSEYGDGQWVDA